MSDYLNDPYREVEQENYEPTLLQEQLYAIDTYQEYQDQD